MNYYKVCLPKASAFEDEYESWITNCYTSRMQEGLYRGTERDYEDDELPILPTGSYMDDLSIDENPTIIID
jgi:hypothetical protein